MNRDRLARELLRLGERAVRRWTRDGSPPQQTGRRDQEHQFEPPARRDQERQFEPLNHPQSPPHGSDEYPGDFSGVPVIDYNPVMDDTADPGEIVWTWVPFEEDHSQGKDRPVLVIGRDGDWLLALQTSTTNDAEHRAREARLGRYWIDIGAGAWDREGRESEVRVNRILRIDPGEVRRVGARLDRQRFDRVAAEVARHY